MLMEESLGMLLENEFILSAVPPPLGQDWNLSRKKQGLPRPRLLLFKLKKGGANIS